MSSESPFSDDKAVLEIQYIFLANLLMLQNFFFGNYQIPIRKSIWSKGKTFFGKLIESIKGKNPKQKPIPKVESIEEIQKEYFESWNKEAFETIKEVWNPIYEETKNRPTILGVVKEYLIGQGYEEKTVKELNINETDKKLKENVQLPKGLDDLEELAKVTGLKGTDLYAYAYTQNHGAELMAVYNENNERSGRIYEIVTKMNRDIIKEAIKQGKTVDQLRSNFVFPDIEEMEVMIENSEDSKLQGLFLEHLNRDFFRLATTEMAIAYENGKRIKRLVDNRIYSKFEGGGSSSRKKGSVKRCDSCQEAIGTVLMEFASEEDFKKSEYYGGQDDVINDDYATKASWIGKSNFGLNVNSWLVCTPMHPNCSCNQVSFNPGKKRFIDEDDFKASSDKISDKIDKKYMKKEKSHFSVIGQWHEPTCSHEFNTDWVKDYLNK